MSNSIIWSETVKAGDVDVALHVFDSGTHCLSFDRHSGPGDDGRYVSIGFQFTGADLDAIAAMIGQMKAARVVTVDLAIMEAC